MNLRGKNIVLALALFMVLSMAGISWAGLSDIQGHWAASRITASVEQGLTSGYPDGSFKPDNNITRAEFITITNRACKFTTQAAINYSDIPANVWFAAEIAKARSAGYISGYNDGTMRPNQPISRQEAAAILARISKLDTVSNIAVADKFKDAGEMPAWSKGAIGAVVAKGYMNGYPDQTYRPEKPITRAETVVTLYNAIKDVVPQSNDTVYNKAGVYGPASGVDTIEGNVFVSAPGVTVQNLKITGNLILAETVGEGDVTLKNITVVGSTTIKGGGSHSVVMENCKLPTITVDKKGVRVVASGNTSVSVVQLNSGATLVELSISGTGFETVTLTQSIPGNAPVTLEGSFNNVNVQTPAVQLNVNSGTVTNLQVADTAKGASLNIADNAKISTLTLNAAAAVSGKGKIDTAKVNAAGSTIEQKPTTVINPSGVNVSIGTPASGSGTASTQTVTVSGIELTNTFGAFKFSTNVVTTAENILAKIKVNGVALQSVEKRTQGTDGTAWKGFVENPQRDTNYTITCDSPFTITGTSLIRWAGTVSAPAVTGVLLEDVGDSGTASDLKASFNAAAGENQKIGSYRIMVVRSSNAGSFNLTAANAVSAANYIVVDKSGAASYMLTLDGAKDTSGNSITTGIAYKIFVLSVADGTNSTVNSLSAASNEITLAAAPGGGGGGGGDVTAPAFAAAYPKLNNIGAQTVDLLVKTNEGGNAYYVVLANDDPSPTAAQVKAGLAANNVAVIPSGNSSLSANTEATINISGLNQNTAYDIYVVVEDLIPNVQPNPTKIDLQTINPPDQSTANVTTASNMTRRNPINLSIAGAKDINGTALNGSINVTVSSDKVGVAFNDSVSFIDGAAIVLVPTGDAAPDFTIPTELGLHTLTVTIAGVTENQTVPVTIADSVIDGNRSTAAISPALGKGAVSTVTVTLRDTNNNLIANTTKNMKIVLTITNDNIANGESYTINEPYKTENSTTNANITTTIISDNTPTDANGQYSFTITLPDTIDIGDGISVQVTQNQITKKIGNLFEYQEN